MDSRTLDRGFVQTSPGIFRLEVANVPLSRVSSSEDVSDPRRVGSFKDGDTKLGVDETKSQSSVLGTLPFGLPDYVQYS